ncbi:CU044_2847 family protein [Streptomyces sp. enrichment culture]|uniref:CU044_2847 family protein n=1 Tax=Streptomyces sp. enrichment culture TaxID=1795815 RepID=UPI003F576568
MPEYLELDLAGTAVRIEVAAVGEASAPSGLPEEFGVPSPVAAGGGGLATLAADGLRGALRPLGPLLDEVHAAVSAAEQPPESFTVEFGVELGKDLKLGIVSAGGRATMKVSATWRQEPHGA